MVTLFLFAILNGRAAAIDHIDFPDLVACMQAKEQIDNLKIIGLGATCINIDLG